MVIAIYFTNWSIYARGYSPQQLPLDVATHVIYAFFKPNAATGEIELSDPWADIEKPMDLGGRGCIGELARLKQDFPHIRVVPSIGGYTYTAMVAETLRDPAKRQAFVTSATALVHTYKFDGIDIDWEYPENAADGQALLATVRMLRQSLGPQADLMIAAPAGLQNIQNFPLSEIDRHLSYWNIMAYDFSGPWSPTTAHHAQLYGPGINADEVVRHYSQYVRPSKLVLGVPVYGRSFASSKGLGLPFSGSLPSEFEAGVHDFKTLPLPGHTETTDRRHGAAYCQDGQSLVSYDNIESAQMKAGYARQHGLAGGMFWEASGDRRGESLIRAFVSTFGSS